MSDYYPSDPNAIRQHGMKGIISTGAGVGLVVVNSLLGIPVVGWILSSALVVLGVMGLVGKERTDKTTGSILVGVGALGVASILFGKFTGFVLGLGGLGLIGYGIFNLFKFAKGLKSRS